MMPQDRENLRLKSNSYLNTNLNKNIWTHKHKWRELKEK